MKYIQEQQNLRTTLRGLQRRPRPLSSDWVHRKRKTWADKGFWCHTIQLKRVGWEETGNQNNNELFLSLDGSFEVSTTCEGIPSSPRHSSSDNSNLWKTTLIFSMIIKNKKDCRKETSTTGRLSEASFRKIGYTHKALESVDSCVISQTRPCLRNKQPWMGGARISTRQGRSTPAGFV